MQLQERDGIACDQCGTVYRHDFSYYCLDFHHVVAHGGHRPPLETILSSQVVFSLDICTVCYDKMTREIIEHYNSMASTGSVSGSGAICELSGRRLTDIYYHVNVIRVEVLTSGQPAMCSRCKTVTSDTDRRCVKCGHDSFVRPALVRTDNRHLEFDICENVYKELTEKAATVRQIAGQWATRV